MYHAMTRINSALIDSSSCTGAFGSPIFSIYAGPSQTRLYVHASIVAKSPVLRKIVEGDWEDSHERVIFLEDHDTATVECMLQWLYCGYYTWCDTITPAASPNPGITSDGNRNYVTSLAADGGRLIWLSPRTFLEGRELVAHPSDSEPTTASNPRKILGLVLPDQSRKMYRELSNHHEASLIEEAVRVCTPNGTTLLRDAKLYALAQYLELPRLKSLTLQNIKMSSMTSPQSPKRQIRNYPAMSSSSSGMRTSAPTPSTTLSNHCAEPYLPSSLYITRL